ncbi:MAG TPA: choice-of-anchor D domain-containing protein [Terriglobia bacterium]
MPKCILGAAPQRPHYLSPIAKAGTSKIAELTPENLQGSINFGNVAVGGVGTQTVTLTNYGKHNWTITQVSVTGAPFSVAGISPPVTIQPGQSLSFTVDFSPTSTGIFTGSMTLTMSSSSQHTISLTGTGVTGASFYLTLTPTSLSFGPTAIGATASLSFLATNTGTGSVTISSDRVAGAGFTLSGPSLPLTLNPNQSRSFAADFSPSTYGTFTGTASLSSNATGSPSSESLSGTAHVVSLSWDGSTGATSYNVYREQSGGLYAIIGSSVAPTTTYQDWTVTPAQTYSYYVTAVSSSGESGPSNYQTVQVPSP